jgi:hypothetical protein
MADSLDEEQRAKVYKFWGRVYEASAPDISRSTVSIYGYHQNAIRQNGSGVLLQIGDEHFLLSAAHVIDFTSIHDIPYLLSPAKGTEPVALNKFRVGTSPIPPNRDPKDPNMRDDDLLDVGFIELNQSIVERLLPVRRFATLREVDVDGGLKRGCYLILGYPHKLSVTDPLKQKIYSEPLRYITELCDDPADKFDPTREVQLKYPEKGLNAGMAEVIVPSPKGMSGCGIWRLAEMKPSVKWSKDDVKLVAIDHMWHGERRFIRGTRVRYALQLIYKFYSSLRPIMDLNLGLVTRDWSR